MLQCHLPRLIDTCRGTIAFEDRKVLEEVVSKAPELFSAAGFSIARFDDRFNNPVSSGYRDYQFNLKLSGAPFICEVQFHLCSIKNLADRDHKYYEMRRYLT
jgi:hypothetical protein